MPMPRSVTAISMSSPRLRLLIDTDDPFGEYAMALDTRLAMRGHQQRLVTKHAVSASGRPW